MTLGTFAFAIVVVLVGQAVATYAVLCALRSGIRLVLESLETLEDGLKDEVRAK